MVLGGGGGCAPVEASEEKEKERLGAKGPAERPESACRDSPGDSGCSEPLKLLPALPGGPWLKPRLQMGSSWVMVSSGVPPDSTAQATRMARGSDARCELKSGKMHNM